MWVFVIVYFLDYSGERLRYRRTERLPMYIWYCVSLILFSPHPSFPLQRPYKLRGEKRLVGTIPKGNDPCRSLVRRVLVGAFSG